MSEETETLVQMGIDTETCIGAGQCEMMEEETFLLSDDTGIAGLIGSGMLPLDRATTLVDTCPSGAIRIVERTGAVPAVSDEDTPK